MELKRREVIPSSTVLVPASKGGYRFFRFNIATEGKKEQVVFFTLSVLQPAGRQDFDINFFVADDANFQKWVTNAPNVAFIIAPRLIFGEVSFRPPSSGFYYAVLNNQYSVLTPKSVIFASYETWIEERIEQTVEQAFQVNVGSRAKRGFLRKIYDKLRYSNALGLVALLLVVQIAAFLTAGVIMLLFRVAFNLEYRDSIGYVAASVGPSTLVILFALYYFRTGKPLTTAPQ
ncbi:MAG: hypothetical protein ABSB28_05960 [Candidatus Bathyarchaeia archaeon]